MKKFYMILFAVLMTLSTVNAKVVMTESFDRETGRLSPGANTSMGTNTTDWWSYSGSSNYIQVAEGTLSYPGYKTTGEGNKAYIWSTGADDFRKFASPVTSGKVYVAAIINVAELRQGTSGDYFLSLGNGGIAGTDAYARLSTKSVSDGTSYYGFRLGLNKVNESTTFMRYTNEVYSPNTNYLVVVEYEFVEGEKNDEVRLYVNPTKANTTPTLVCVQDTTNAAGTSTVGANTKADVSQIAAVYLRQGTNTPRQMYVDEIKVTTSWTELFEAGGEDPTPVINAASSVAFDKVTINEAAEKTITVKGSYLKGAINVSSSSAVLVPAVSTISKDAAEASSGYALKLTLTATEAGEGSASITLSSTGAADQTVGVSWTAAAPAAKVADIAAMKKQSEWGDPVDMESQPTVIRVTEDGAAVQDASGAMFIVDGMGDDLNLKAGDKVALGGLQMIESEYYVETYPTAYAGSISVLSSGNALEPLEVTLAELEKYGPAYVQASNVTFPEDAEKFAAGNIAISQSGTSVNMYIPAGTDIIGEDVPVSADVKGCVTVWYGLKLQISASADVFNRVEKGGESGGDNLILNHSFEEYSCNFTGCQFDEWNMALGSGSSNSADKLDGEASLMLNPTSIATVLDQGVALPDADYATGAKFTLTLNYKVQNMPEGANLALDCYWKAAAGGNSETIAAHESDILKVNLESGSGWQQKVLVTTKPAKSAYFRVRVSVPKNAKVLFDDFSLYYTPSTDPYIEVSPSKLNAVETTLGNTATFQTVHIRQGNLSGKTTFYVGGANADQFSLSANELAADQSDLDLIITYAPTSAGTHSASLIFDNAQHTTILPDMISLSGTCTDPSAKPQITVTPSTVEAFEALEGTQQKKTVTLSSINCTDYVYASVSHIQGAGFTIDGSMYAKNSQATVIITFAPQEAGTFQSTITFYSANAENVVIELNGTGIAKTPETIDWKTDFVWNASSPLALLDERFDTIKHNQTLLFDGWQNVAGADQRPWWGFDASLNQAIDGDEKCAKATAYQSGKESTGDWDMWLVTPALDYKNAASKIFAFSVMSQNVSDDGNADSLRIYYIDASNPTNVFFQDLSSNFDLPKQSSDNYEWRTFFLDLTGQQYIPDVFYMAFRYSGKNGNEGGIVYYIDDVSWGRTDLPTINVTPSVIVDTAYLNVKTTIATLNITTSNVEGAISLTLAGANYNRFSLSQSTLPAAGGEVTVTFEGQEAGVHEAYITLSAKGAAAKFVTMAVLCQEEGTGIETVESQKSKAESYKILRDGRILILRDGKSFNLLGTRVE